MKHSIGEKYEERYSVETEACDLLAELKETKSLEKVFTTDLGQINEDEIRGDHSFRENIQGGVATAYRF